MIPENERGRLRWYASYPKSGQTWARKFHIAYEDPGNFHINRIPDHFTQDVDRRFYEDAAPCPVKDLTEDEGFHLRNAAFVRMIHQCERPYVYVKTHAARVALHWMPLIPPPLTNRAVYIIRDPRAVAVSVADHMKDGTIDGAIDLMANRDAVLHRGTMIKQLTSTWSLHVDSWTRENVPIARCFLRFEDMKVAPDKVFRMMLDFWEIPFDAGRFRAALDLTTFENLQNDERKYGYRWKSPGQDRFFRVGQIDAWRDVLTPEQIRRIESDHGEMMVKWGYPLEMVEAA